MTTNRFSNINLDFASAMRQAELLTNRLVTLNERVNEAREELRVTTLATNNFLARVESVALSGKSPIEEGLTVEMADNFETNQRKADEALKSASSDVRSHLRVIQMFLTGAIRLEKALKGTPEGDALRVKLNELARSV